MASVWFQVFVGEMSMVRRSLIGKLAMDRAGLACVDGPGFGAFRGDSGSNMQMRVTILERVIEG